MARDAGELAVEEGGAGLVAFVARQCGAAAVERLCAELGGNAVLIPKEPKPHHVLCRVLGVEAVRRIADEWGWGRVTVPLGSAATHNRLRAQAFALFAAGKSAAAVARELGVHYRTATRYRAALRQTEES